MLQLNIMTICSNVDKRNTHHLIQLTWYSPMNHVSTIPVANGTLHWLIYHCINARLPTIGLRELPLSPERQSHGSKCTLKKRL